MQSAYKRLRELAMAETDIPDRLAALRQHIDSELVSLRREIDQRFEGMKEATTTAMAAAEKATAAALNAAQRAVEKAETASERRFDGVNEFRAALSDQQNTLMPRAEAMSRFTAVEEKVTGLSSRIDRGEGRGSGLSAGWGYLVGGALLLIAVITLVMKFAGN